MLPSEHFSCSAEGGEDFVGDEEGVVPGGELADLGEDGGRVHEHAAGAQDEGFDDEGGVGVFVLREDVVDGGEGAGDVGGVVGWGGDEVDGEGEAAEGIVEERDPPYRDSADG